MENTSYFEWQSIIENSTLNISNARLIESMRNTAVQGFGWPIGVVIDVEQYRPKGKDKLVEAIIKTDESFDTWTLSSSGDFYLLKTLFEEKRDRTAIYLDVRLVRLLEAFARTAALYKSLGVAQDSRIKIQFRYGGLSNRVLKIANPRRMPLIQQKVSSIDSFSRIHEATLSQLIDVNYLENTVITYGMEFAQIFDSFELQQTLASELLKEHAVYQGVVQALRQ